MVTSAAFSIPQNIYSFPHISCNNPFWAQGAHAKSVLVDQKSQSNDEYNQHKTISKKCGILSTWSDCSRKHSVGSFQKYWPDINVYSLSFCLHFRMCGRQVVTNTSAIYLYSMLYMYFPMIYWCLFVCFFKRNLICHLIFHHWEHSVWLKVKNNFSWKSCHKISAMVCSSIHFRMMILTFW